MLALQDRQRGDAGVGQELEEPVEVVRGGDRQRAGTVDRPLGHAGQHAARAELDELRHPFASQREQHLLPPNGAGELGRQQAGPLLTLVVGEGIDVRHDGHLGVAWVGLGDGLAQPVAGRGHERRVERPADRQGHHPLGAELLGLRAGRADTLGRAGDDHLAGGVEVGDPHVVVGQVAGHLDLVVVEAEDGSHRAGVVEAGVVHGVGPLDHQAQALLEGQRPAAGERGVLAEAVAGAVVGLDAEALDRVEHHQAGHERGELGVAGVLQLVGVGVEEQAAEVPVRDRGCLPDELPAGVIGPRSSHAGALRPLAWEGEGEHVVARPPAGPLAARRAGEPARLRPARPKRELPPGRRS